jgi:hypothetical protein
MPPQTTQRRPCRPRLPYIHRTAVRTLRRVVRSCRRENLDEMVNLAHKDIRACIEPGGDGVVECVLKGLLLADGGVEEVCAVDVLGL